MSRCINCGEAIAATDPACYAHAVDGGKIEFQCLACGDRRATAQAKGGGAGLSLRLVAELLAAVCLVACGNIRVEKPDNGQSEQDGSQLDTGRHADDSGKVGQPAGEADEPREDTVRPNDNAPDVAVQVAVDVAVVVRSSASPDLEAVRYSPRRRPWQEAVDQAPAGYRLATRAELVALVDAGALADLEPSGPVVWSATEVEARTAQMVELADGQSTPADKALALAALYVLEAN